MLFRNKRKIKVDVEEWLHVSAHHEAIFFRTEYTVEMRHDAYEESSLLDS